MLVAMGEVPGVAAGSNLPGPSVACEYKLWSGCGWVWVWRVYSVYKRPHASMCRTQSPRRMETAQRKKRIRETQANNSGRRRRRGRAGRERVEEEEEGWWDRENTKVWDTASISQRPRLRYQGMRQPRAIFSAMPLKLGVELCMVLLRVVVPGRLRGLACVRVLV